MKRPRVLLADDHRLLREALAQMLEPCFEVVGAVADGRALLTAAKQLRPDIVVLNIALPLLNGLDAARQLKCMIPTLKVIFLTMSEDPELATEAFRIGESGFLLKNSAATDLFQAIHAVLNGRRYITPQTTQGLVGSILDGPDPAAKSGHLSPRRREVLQLLAEGHSMKEIGRLLKITPRTVAFHKYGMMEQFGINSSAELVQFAVKQHVVTV